MPLSDSAPRREVHQRTLDMKAYARDDGLYDVEARLIDTKPFGFTRRSTPAPIPAGQPLHDLWLRLTVDEHYVVRGIEASSDVTPHAVCKEAEATLKVIVGERVGRGWSSRVKQHLGGAAGCTHLMEMLIPMATAAFQGISGFQKMRNLPANGMSATVKVDSCYAWASHREVVKVHFPAQYRPPGAPSGE